MKHELSVTGLDKNNRDEYIFFIIFLGEKKMKIFKKHEKGLAAADSLAFRRCLGQYTVLFIFLSTLIYGGFFLLYQRSFIWYIDGISQYFSALAYYGEHLRTILRHIFVEHQFSIPNFDFSIGYGNDIISTLHYYGIGDPLNLLSVFFRPEHTEFLFGLLYLLRLFFCGASFLIYIFPKKKEILPCLAGAIAYSFAGFPLASIWHPIFLVGLMYLPLILRGIDLVFEKKSPFLFLFSLAACLVSNFFLAYHCCIFMVIYAALKYFTEKRKSGFRCFISLVGQFFLYTLCAFLLSSLIFFPQLLTLGSEKLTVDREIGVFYPLSYYLSLMPTLFDGAKTARSWTYIGFGGIGLLCFSAAAVRFKKNIKLLIPLFLGLLFLLFPFFGSLMNGFSYASGRWSWIFTLLFSAAITLYSDDLFDFSSKELLRLTLIGSALLLLSLLSSYTRGESVFFALLIFFLGFSLVLLAHTHSLPLPKAKQGIFALVALTVFMNAVTLYHPTENNFINEAIVLGEAYKVGAKETAGAAVHEFCSDDTSFYRYDDRTDLPFYNYNNGLWFHQPSTGFYFSIQNPVTGRFISELGLNTGIPYQYRNTDDRAILQLYTGAKYAVGEGEDKLLYTPTGQTKVIENSRKFSSDYFSLDYFHGATNTKDRKEKKINLYQTEYSLPMFYTYDQTISEESFQKMNAAEKQNSLLQAAAVAEGSAEPQIKTEDLQQYDLAQKLSNQKNIEVSEHQITVKKPNTDVTVEMPLQFYSEIYLLWDGFDYQPTEQFRFAKDVFKQDKEKRENGEKVPGFDRLTLRDYLSSRLFFTKPDQVNLFVKTDLGFSEKKLDCKLRNGSNYTEHNQFLVSLGFIDIQELYNDLNTVHVTLRFPLAGTYSFRNLKLCFQSLARITDFAENRKADSFENVQVGEDSVTGEVTLSQPKLVATQIPYSDAWRVFVDGEEREVLKVNDFSCGVDMAAGHHTIEFRYHAPFFPLSLIASLCGVFLTLGIWIFRKRKKSKS